MSIIIGINSLHADSAACLVVEGQLVGAVAEERLGQRIKHDSSFPLHAIRRLLSDAGLRLRDVTHLTSARDSYANMGAKICYVCGHPFRSSGAGRTFLERKRQAGQDVITHHLANLCDEDPDKINYKVITVEHHLAHVASAYYLSPFDSLTAGFSYDGSGDFASLLAARCEGTRINPVGKVTLPSSLGFFYTALCQLIGFGKYGEEYKVMGLAPYGEDKYSDLFRELIHEVKGGWFHLNPDFFMMHEGNPSIGVGPEQVQKITPLYKEKLQELLGVPPGAGRPITQREKDIARSTQARFEEVSIHCLRRLHEMIPTNQLAMAGGCALNGVTNARILRDTPFEVPYLQAASSDDGTCLGAAFHTWHVELNQRDRFHMKHPFWGPEYSAAHITRVAESSEFLARICPSEEDLIETAASLLRDGKVVGWYQGRSEWGPRALGNRSILANPALKDMKDTINKKVKRRESFRPFAPSVLAEKVGTYFEQAVDSPFMMHVVKFRSEWLGRLPAVTHIDGTGRLQSVDRDFNQLYYDLIKRFEEKTGIGMVLNTSFNENEPIVDTPDQALDCFHRTDMDALCLGKCILIK